MDSKYITSELTLLTLLSVPYTVVNMGDILHIIDKSLVCKGFADQPASVARTSMDTGGAQKLAKNYS